MTKKPIASDVQPKTESKTSATFPVADLIKHMTGVLTDGTIESQKKVEIARIEGFYEGYKLAVRETLQLVNTLKK